MLEAIEKLESLIQSMNEALRQFSESELSYKSDPSKWSKKEILGHLIDSAVNNLKRFTEIQFESKPYKIIAYKQDELVMANHYQDSDSSELIDLWVALNSRILFIMKQQSNESLDSEIEFYTGERSDLRFLMTDYVTHMEHHMNQINTESHS